MTDLSSMPQTETYIDVIDNPDYKQDIQSVAGLLGVEVELIEDPRAIALIARDVDRQTSGVNTQFGRKLGTVLGQQVAENGGFAVKAQLYPGMTTDDFRGSIELARETRLAQSSET